MLLKELTDENIKKIKAVFNIMKTKEDLLDLLNYTKKLVFGEKVIPFRLRQINYHCNPKNNLERYTQFPIKKKNSAA